MSADSDKFRDTLVDQLSSFEAQLDEKFKNIIIIENQQEATYNKLFLQDVEALLSMNTEDAERVVLRLRGAGPGWGEAVVHWLQLCLDQKKKLEVHNPEEMMGLTRALEEMEGLTREDGGSSSSSSP